MLDKHTIEYSSNNYVNQLQPILDRLGLWDTPTTFDNSLSWYQGLKYVLQFLIEQVIPPMQDNDTKMNELIDYYNEVVDYVNNYFDNLDVQEEINNKINQMAEDGSLLEIIKPYIQSEEQARIQADTYEENARIQSDINLQNQINVEKSRIDNISQLPNGSTSGDAELIDIRTDYKGKTHNSAGNSVRNQITTLNNASYSKSINLNDFVLINQSITTNGDIGSTVNITPTTSTTFNCIITKCKKGDKFSVTGTGGNNVLLWCLTDENYNILSKSNSNLTKSNLILDIENDGYLICNFLKANPYSLLYYYSLKTVDENLNILAYSSMNLDNFLQQDKTISTNGEIGSTINIVPSSNSQFASIITKCKKGDKFNITGTGGNNALLWCLTDGNYNILSKSNSNLTKNNFELKVKNDGYLICNFLLANTHSLTHFYSLKTIDEDYKNINYSNTDLNNLAIKGHYINTNQNIGTTIDITPTVLSSFDYIMLKCYKNDIFNITGYGGNNPLLWCLLDENYTILERSNSSIHTENFQLLVKENGYLICNFANNYNYSLSGNISPNTKFELINSLFSKNEEKSNIPLVKFEDNFEFKNITNEMNNIDYSTENARKTILEQVYNLFDNLVTNYPDYVSKTDLGTLLEMNYPEYANGVTESGTYEITPQYKTFMYTLKSTNPYAGNETTNKKKKLLIISGLHGNEIAAPFNTYLLAKQLCTEFLNDSNYFKLRNSFDIYIVPCLNGYGMYHLTRQNANGVNINRNYPVKNWSKSGQPFDTNYTGETPNS